LQERFRGMHLKRPLIIVFGIAIMILATTAANGLFFTTVFVVSGTVQYQGHIADKGLPIVAFIGDDKVAESQVRDNGAFELRIPEYDPSKPEVKGYRSSNDVVQVKLDGKNAKPTFTPNADNLKIDLRVETSLDVRLSTWGKIKALFK
jgi:hypothetical protein